jgi:hypothetical protein
VRKFHLLLYLRSTKASRLESYACMFQELSKNRLTQARRGECPMPYISKEKPSDITTAKTERRKNQRTPTSGKIKRRYPVGLSTSAGFLFQDQNAIAMSIRVEKQLCSLIANDHADSVSCARMIKRRKERPHPFFMCTSPAMQNFPHSCAQCPKTFCPVATNLTPRSHICEWSTQ